MAMLNVYVYVLFSICLTSTDRVAAQGISGLLNRLYNAALQNNKPIVLIIDKNNVQREVQKPPPKPTNLILEPSSESEEELQPAVYLIQSPVSPSTLATVPPPPPQKRLPPARGLSVLSGLGLGLLSKLGLGSLGDLSSLGGLASLGAPNEFPVYRPRGYHHPKVYKGHFKVGRPTPSPIVKLLRQNDCDATQSCIDKCKDQFGGKKRMVCKAKCEVTYECVPADEQQDDDDDPCEDPGMECGDKNPSTRGIVLVTEKPVCTKC